ncbi:MAG: rRNA maturation RNase YbeY [Ruminococcaceae bacterium]|nr:rRNA maturation RNase YbeY [Oscillospiraceae bacterium]
MINLYWENEQEKYEITETHINIIKTCIEAVLSFENISFDCEVSLTLTDNENIAVINAQTRNINSPTDVLSFPMLDAKEGVISPCTEDFSDGFLLLGDIVISFERAKEQAEQFGHSIEREIGFLTVHSMLHLLGYDHESSHEDEKIMFEKQENILNSINLTR